MNIEVEIERFLRRTGMPPTRFGRAAAGDPRLVFDMRLGREIRPRLAARVRTFMQGHAQ
jgi:hypothetical protein